MGLSGSPLCAICGVQLVCGTISEAGNLQQEEETDCTCQRTKVKSSGDEDTMGRGVVEGCGKFVQRENNYENPSYYSAKNWFISLKRSMGTALQMPVVLKYIYCSWVLL